MGIETQFSIYKIDNDKVKTDEIKGFSDINIDNRLEYLIRNIKNSIKSKKDTKQQDIRIDGFVGITYRTINKPNWDGMISDLYSKMGVESSFGLDNVNVSYVLLYQIEDSIYAMTGGFGSHAIKNYIERNWGLYLMPKILGEDEGVIKAVKENNLYGNTVSVSKSNRFTTNIIYEKKKNAVLNELTLEVDNQVADIFGLTDIGIHHNSSLLLKDSLCFRKSIGIAKLKGFLNEIYKIEQNKDKYAMGYFVSSSQVSISKSSLFDELITSIQNKNCNSFIIVGDDYQKYYTDSYKYIITDENGEDFYSTEEAIEFNDLIKLIEEKNKLTKKGIIIGLNKWKISTKDSDGNYVEYSMPVLNAIHGIVEHGENKVPCFLLHGNWYCMNTRYIAILDDDFSTRIKKQQAFVKKIKTKFSLKSSITTENEYNDSFFEKNDIIVAHKSLIDKYEIADLIFYDDDTLYLMCNKKSFNAVGSRDLTNQMWTSANYLSAKLYSKDRFGFLENYYRSISDRYKKEKHDLKISKRDFSLLFDRKICFIAGYMEKYTIKAESNYAKYLDVDISKKIFDLGFDCLSMNIK